MRDAKSDLSQLRDINCLGDFNKFASEALPHWIKRAVEAEALIRELQTACREREERLP